MSVQAGRVGSEARMRVGLVVVVLLALLGITVLGLAFPTTAAADNADCPTCAGGGHGGGGVGDPPSNPTPPGHGGGGGGVGVPPPINGYPTTTWTDDPAPPTEDGRTCATTRTINTGIGGQVVQRKVGHTAYWMTRWLHDGDDWRSVSYIANIVCHYPPAWTDARVRCLIDVSVAVQIHAPRAGTLATEHQQTPYARSGSLGDCSDSGLYLEVQTPIEEFGRYSFSGVANVQVCSERTHTESDPRTGTVPPAELINCGSPYTTHPPVSRWQLDCSGFYRSWQGNPSWTLHDCGGGRSGGAWQCSEPGENRFGGYSFAAADTAVAFRDGADRGAEFGVSTPTGAGISLGAARTHLVRAAGSSPVPDHLSIRTPGASQNLLREAHRTSTVPGVQSAWDIAAIWASNPGAATRLTAHYHHELSYSFQTERVVGWEWSLDYQPVLHTASRTHTIDTTADCASDPLRISYVRAVSGR